MTDFSFAIQLEDQVIIPEFQPLHKTELVYYLRRMEMRWQLLCDRQKYLMEKMEELTRSKIVYGQTVEERIKEYAYGSHGPDSTPGGGTRYNPDTLFNRWIKIYEPFEAQRLLYQNSLFRVLYEQWQVECVNRNIDMLPVEQRDLIQFVYVQGGKVTTYCRSSQLGHDRYNQLKEDALQTLLTNCNSNLQTLYENWEKVNEEVVMDSVPGCPDPGNLAGPAGS